MTPETRQCTVLFLSGFLAQAPGLAEMFLRLHPEQVEIAQAYLDAVERMREWCERRGNGAATDPDQMPLFAGMNA